MRQGRPLRFLAVVLCGWVAVRVALLWPDAPGDGTRERDATKPVALRPVIPTAARTPSVRAQQEHDSANVVGRAGSAGSATRRALAGKPAASERIFARGTGPASPSVVAPTAADARPRQIVDGQAAPPSSPSVAVGVPVASATADTPARLHGDAWLIVRPGGGQSLAFGQLGASQVGARLTYAVGGGAALSVRASAPLQGRGAEAGLGVDWRPARLPVHLLVEARAPLQGVAVRPAAQLIAGGAQRLPLGFRAEAYGQAGAVHRRGGFADGAAYLARPLASHREMRLEVGGGAWGAVQRGVSRVDVGPTAALIVPGLRLGLDYRARVAGQARPGSGVALTLGSGF